MSYNVFLATRPDSDHANPGSAQLFQPLDVTLRILRQLSEVPRQVQELANTTEELRGRAQGPERAWSRAEAMRPTARILRMA